MPEATSDPLRLVDILTTASAVTNYFGAAETTVAHVVSAVEILQGRESIEDLGRPVSPLGRAARGEPGVSPALRELVQRWFARLGAHGEVKLAGDDLTQFLADLHDIDQPGPPA